MSTRGAYGFRVDNKDYVTYNHSDSYPSYLGENILEQTKALLSKYSVEELKDKVAAIKLKSGGEKPTKKDILALKEYTDINVGDRSTNDWYCLTRGLQGSLIHHIRSGYMLDDSNFLLDSVYCEWAYIVNLDDCVFEIYKGFTKQKGSGRYDSIKTKGDYGVRLIVAYPFDKLQNLNSVEVLVNSLEEE